MSRYLGALILVLGLASCAQPVAPAVRGTLDLRNYDWGNGPVPLVGEWAFEGGWRSVPDRWTGTAGGGPDGRGSGTYVLTVRLPDPSPPLGLRYRTASTALRIKANGTVVAQAGVADKDYTKTVAAYAPGSVDLPEAQELVLEILVSNNVYRVGGLWSVPTLGPARVQSQNEWTEEAQALALATTLATIAFVSLLFFGFRPSEKTFTTLGIFAFVVGLRPLVTGQYDLVRLLPGIPFDLVIRLEYLTAFLPIPAAVLFFESAFRGIWGPKTRLALLVPSLVFALLAVVLPLDLLTRSIQFFYPVAIPTILFAVISLGLKIRGKPGNAGFLLGIAVLGITGLADSLSAGFFATSGSLIPWGLGLFVVLQVATLTQRLLESFKKNESLLVEKELLMREVHHRVKNSLQVVASLVSLQSHRTDDKTQKATFMALRQRITAIALVHEKLYGRGLGGKPDLGEYLVDLVRLQYPGDGLESRRVAWDVHIDPLQAGVDDCVDAGLILTELMSNAQKHGLRPRHGGRLSVDVRVVNGRLLMEVADDGPGFPEAFEPSQSKGLGFRLIQALLQRHEGILSVLPGPGGRVRVDLKAPPGPR